MNNLRKLMCATRNFAYKCKRSYSNDLYEPTYLEAFKSKIPIYEIVNVQLHGYDYCVLESYQKWLHNITKNMNLDIENGWATPAQHLQITSYKPNSEIINSQYQLKQYHRTIQINAITSLQLSTLLRILDSSTPVGVSVNVVPHEDYHEEVRYVPDMELATLKEQLDTMGGPTTKK